MYQAGEPELHLDRIYEESQLLPLQQKLIKLLLIYETVRVECVINSEQLSFKSQSAFVNRNN